MKETATIRLHADGQRASWRVHSPLHLDGDTAVTPVAEAVAACIERRVVLIVPGTDVLLTETRLPVRQPQKLLQAIPYALEDQLAEDIEHLHFATGPRQSDGSVPVAVVSRRRMDAWLEPFLAAGVRPDAMHPDVLCLPPPHGDGPAWSVLLEPDCTLVRRERYQGFACEPALLAELAELAAPPPDLRVTVWAPAGDADAGRALPGEVNTVSSDGDALDILLRGLAARHSVNLLQGRYALGREQARWWLPWRATAALAAALLLLHLGVQGVSLWRLSARAAALETEAGVTFQTLFPEVDRIVNMRVQGERRLAELGRGGPGEAGLLFLLGHAARALSSTPGLVLDEMTYDDGRLALSLHGTDLQALERLRTEFAVRSGVTLDVESASADAEGVRIRVTLRASGARPA